MEGRPVSREILDDTDPLTRLAPSRMHENSTINKAGRSLQQAEARSRSSEENVTVWPWWLPNHARRIVSKRFSGSSKQCYIAVSDMLTNSR